MDVGPDGIYLSYGYIGTNANRGWYVEKWPLNINSTSQPLWSRSVATDYSVTLGACSEPKKIKLGSDGVYSAGFLNFKWLVEKRDKLTGDPIWINNPGNTNNMEFATALGVDSSGAYVGGSGGDFINLSSLYWRINKYLGLSYIDCGLKVRESSATVSIACEPLGTITSPLRIRRSDNNTYGVVLVDPADASASKMRINTSSGIKALRKYP
jgi:hypothetical protein